MFANSLMRKSGVKAYSIQKLKDFNDCVTHCGIADLKSMGKFRSWHNNSQGQNRICGKLDKALCNDKWIELLLESYVEHKTHPVGVRILSCFQEEMMVQKDPIELEKMMA